MLRVILAVLMISLTGCTSLMDVSVYGISPPKSDFNPDSVIIIHPAEDSNWHSQHQLSTVISAFRRSGINAFTNEEVETANIPANYFVYYDFSKEVESYQYEYTQVDRDYVEVGTGVMNCKQSIYDNSVDCKEDTRFKTIETKTPKVKTKTIEYRTLKIWVYDLLKSEPYNGQVYYSYAMTKEEQCNDNYVVNTLSESIANNIRIGPERKTELTLDVTGCSQD